MPYISELSSGNGLDPNRLLDGMAQNIAYFRQKRQERTNFINQQNALLAESGMANKVQTTMDEDGNISNDLTGQQKMKQGGLAGNQEYLANQTLYNTKGEDLTHMGSNTKTEQSMADEAMQQTFNTKNKLESDADRTAYELAQRGLSNTVKQTPGNLNTNPGLPDNSQPLAPPQLPNADQVKEVTDGVNALAQPTQPQQPTQDRLGLMNGITSPAPVQPTQPAQPAQPAQPTNTTQQPQTQRSSVAMRAGTSQSNSESIRLKGEGEYKSGEAEINVPVSKTTTTYDPTFHDEIQKDYTKLNRMSALMQNMYEGGGGNGVSPIAANFAQQAQSRLAQIKDYETEMRKRGSTTDIKFDKVKIKGSEGKASFEDAKGDSARTTISTAVNASHSSGQGAQIANQPFSLQLADNTMQGYTDAQGNYTFSGGVGSSRDASHVTTQLNNNGATVHQAPAKNGATKISAKLPSGGRVSYIITKDGRMTNFEAKKVTPSEGQWLSYNGDVGTDKLGKTVDMTAEKRAHLKKAIDENKRAWQGSEYNNAKTGKETELINENVAVKRNAREPQQK